MEPVLIYKDDRKIQEEIDYLDEIIIQMRNVYDEFKAIGITVSFLDLRNLTQVRTDSYLKNLIADKLLDIAGEPTIAGVKIQREKLRELLSMPDLTLLKEALVNFCSFRDSVTPGGIRINLLSLDNDIISKTADADSKIDAEYTFYTKTDSGAQIANQLNAICDALNNHSDQMGDFLFGADKDFATVVGLKRLNYRYVIDLTYIRQREGKPA